MAVSEDVVFAAAILGNGKARGARVHREPVDTDGVGFGFAPAMPMDRSNLRS
jgi:hypothetical protein